MGTLSFVIINLIGMLVLMYAVFWMQKRRLSFGTRVMTGLGLGILFGLLLQGIYGPQSQVIKESNSWFSIIGSGYVRLLTMIVMPLIIVSINGQLVPKDRYQTQKVNDNDEVKVIHIYGGG